MITGSFGGTGSLLHDSPLSFEGERKKESIREAKPLLYKLFPLPLIKGKGIKGIGFPNKNLKGVR